MDVKRGPILFRCDGTQDLGWEPLYQCLSFAAALQRRRRGTHFFSYLDPLSLAHSITRGNNAWQPAEHTIGSQADLTATLAEVRRLNAAAVVVSGTVDDEYLTELRATGTLVLSFNQSAMGVCPADLVVNPYLAPVRKHYRVRVGGQILTGRKYALVRGIFRRQRTIRATEQPAPFRGLVAFGDDDRGDQTLLRTRQLLEAPKVEKVTMVAHTHHPRYEDLKDFCKEVGNRVELITETKELMTRLVRAHFVLTSGDMTALEMCCVGLPQLIISDSQSHAANGRRMDDEGMATYLGDTEQVSMSVLHEAVGIILDDPMERLTMSRCARNLVDGRGGDRIVNGMEIMLHTPSRAMPAMARAA